jgi:hypothetical protein
MDTELSQQNLDFLRLNAKFIAIVVRNAMEDFHHKYLSDAQMKELNPIIRNAVFTALYVKETMTISERSKAFVKYHFDMIPDYWEQPELLSGF